VLVTRHDSVEALARRIGCTAGHIRNLLADRYGGSRRITERLLSEFGPKAWAFVIGATNTIDLEDIA
jgi:hypothetical protein